MYIEVYTGLGFGLGLGLGLGLGCRLGCRSTSSVKSPLVKYMPTGRGDW